MQDERRRFLKAEAMRIKLAASSTDQQKNNKRERKRKERAKLTSEEAAAATKRNTESWRQPRDISKKSADTGHLTVVS